MAKKKDEKKKKDNDKKKAKKKKKGKKRRKKEIEIFSGEHKLQGQSSPFGRIAFFPR